MERIYAQALWQLVSTGMDAKRAVHAVNDRLVQEGRASLIARVGHTFAKIAERESRKSDYTLTVARHEDLVQAKKALKTFTEELGIEIADLKTQVDDSLIGGWRLEGNERLVDASYKRQLLDLYNNVTRV